MCKVIFSICTSLSQFSKFIWIECVLFLSFQEERKKKTPNKTKQNGTKQRKNTYDTAAAFKRCIKINRNIFWHFYFFSNIKLIVFLHFCVNKMYNFRHIKQVTHSHCTVSQFSVNKLFFTNSFYSTHIKFVWMNDSSRRIKVVSLKIDYFHCNGFHFALEEYFKIYKVEFPGVEKYLNGVIPLKMNRKLLI